MLDSHCDGMQGGVHIRIPAAGFDRYHGPTEQVQLLISGQRPEKTRTAWWQTGGERALGTLQQAFDPDAPEQREAPEKQAGSLRNASMSTQRRTQLDEHSDGMFLFLWHGLGVSGYSSTGSGRAAIVA